MKGSIGVKILFALAGCIVLAACGKSSSETTGTNPTEVPIIRGDSNIVVEGRLVPRESVKLAFSIGGKVAEVLIQEGAYIKTGDVIARLGNRETTEASIANAELELLNAQHALADLDKQTEVARIEALSRIAAATKAVRDAKYQLDNFTIPANQAALDAFTAVAQMKEKLETAQANFKLVKYSPENYPTRNDLKEALDEAQSDYNSAVRRLEYEIRLETAQAELDKATKDYQEVMNGPRTSDTEAAQARIKAAEAMLASAKAVLDNLELVATIDGKVVELDLIVGEQVIPNREVVTIADTSTWYVETDNLTEIEVVGVVRGENVIVTPDAIPDKQMVGVVDAISDLYEEKRGDITYTVRIRIDEMDERLRWGMTVIVTFER